MWTDYDHTSYLLIKTHLYFDSGLFIKLKRGRSGEGSSKGNPF